MVLSNSNVPRWKTANLCCICIGQKQGRKAEACTCAFLPFSPFHSSHTSFCPFAVHLFSFSLSPTLLSLLCHLPLPLVLSPSLSLSLLVQGDESGCVRVWKSTPQGLYSQPHERFMMLTRVGVSVHLCSGRGLEKWNKERQREKRKESGGIRV